MGKKQTKSKRNAELKVIFFIILVALALFIISTYAWFSTQRNVSITNLNGTVEVAEGLEISLDALNWSNEIVLGDGEGQLNIINDAYTGHRNISPTEMLPVSTLGLKGTNKTDITMLRGKITNSKKLTEIVAMDETVTDSEAADYAGYFAFDIFLKNSSKDTSKDDILQLNYDSSVHIMASSETDATAAAEDEENRAGTGLQNTVRVAFAKYGGTTGSGGNVTGVTDVMAGQEEILKTTGAITGGDNVYITDVAIWEPNSNDHVEYIVNNNNNITWTSTDGPKYGTWSDDKGVYLFNTTTKMPTYALTDAALNNTIADVYDWDGSTVDENGNKHTTAVLQKQVTLQTTKTSEDDYLIKEGVQNLKSTSDDTLATNFSIAPNCVIRLRVYVWLEGQDVDCINYASYGGGVTVNIGLVKGAEEGSKGEADGAVTE